MTSRRWVADSHGGGRPSGHSHLVVDAVEVGAKALVEPPAGVADLGADVACVRRAEGPSVMVPGKRIFHCTAETRHMEAVAVFLTIHPAAKRRIFTTTLYSNLCLFFYKKKIK